MAAPDVELRRPEGPGMFVDAAPDNSSVAQGKERNVVVRAGTRIGDGTI